MKFGFFKIKWRKAKQKNWFILISKTFLYTILNSFTLFYFIKLLLVFIEIIPGFEFGQYCFKTNVVPTMHGCLFSFLIGRWVNQ